MLLVLQVHGVRTIRPPVRPNGHTWPYLLWVGSSPFKRVNRVQVPVGLLLQSTGSNPGRGSAVEVAPASFSQAKTAGRLIT